MKIRTLISILILVLAVLIIAGSCATGKKAVKAPLEPFFGTWVNPDYNGTGIDAKLIYKPDGTYIEYSHTDITRCSVPYKYNIQESWMDSDGKKYYKVEAFIFEKYSLYRLDETDSVLERVWSNVRYPSEIDPKHFNYRIYYRQ
jgi:hypothetical protein